MVRSEPAQRNGVLSDAPVGSGAGRRCQQSSPLVETTADNARELLNNNQLSAFLVMKHLMPLDAPVTRR